MQAKLGGERRPRRGFLQLVVNISSLGNSEFQYWGCLTDNKPAIDSNSADVPQIRLQLDPLLENTVLLRSWPSKSRQRDNRWYWGQDDASTSATQSWANMGQSTARLTCSFEERAAARCIVEPSLRSFLNPQVMERCVLAHRHSFKFLPWKLWKFDWARKRDLSKTHQSYSPILLGFLLPSNDQEPGP